MKITHIAKIISNLFNPFLIAFLGDIAYIFIGLEATKSSEIIVLSAFPLLHTVIPSILLITFIKLGKINDYEITNKNERTTFFIITLACFGFATLLSIIQTEYFILNLSATITLFLIIVINFKWKISVHLAFDTLIFGILGIFVDRYFFLLFLLLPIIAWSRIYLKKHTIKQTIGGFLLALTILISLVVSAEFFSQVSTFKKYYKFAQEKTNSLLRLSNIEKKSSDYEEETPPYKEETTEKTSYDMPEIITYESLSLGCLEDTDCIIKEADGCCTCNNGGNQIAILKSKEEDYNTYIDSLDCENNSCLTVYKCCSNPESIKAYCNKEKSKCELTSCQKKVTSTTSSNSTNWWEYPAEILETTKNGDDLLVLVNKKYKLAENYAPSDITNLASTGLRYGADKSGRKIMLEDLTQLAQDSKEAEIDLALKSVYRSYSQQVSTYNYWVSKESGDKNKADKYSARPGHSQHQLGTAIDFTTNECGDCLGSNFTNTKAEKWLRENSYLYGFVLSYPAGAESVTGYTYESWHYRYIGKENALAFKESGEILDNWLLTKQ